MTETNSQGEGAGEGLARKVMELMSETEKRNLHYPETYVSDIEFPTGLTPAQKMQFETYRNDLILLRDSQWVWGLLNRFVDGEKLNFAWDEVNSRISRPNYQPPKENSI